MTLLYLTDVPGEYRSDRFGRVKPIGASRLFEAAFPFEGNRRLTGRIPDDERWLLHNWSVVLQDWTPKPLDPKITLTLSSATDPEVSAPLFRIVEPNDRSLALEQRVARLEAAFEIDAKSLRGAKELLPRVFVDQGYSWDAAFDGPYEDIAVYSPLLVLGGIKFVEFDR